METLCLRTESFQFKIYNIPVQKNFEERIYSMETLSLKTNAFNSKDLIFLYKRILKKESSETLPSRIELCQFKIYNIPII